MLRSGRSCSGRSFAGKDLELDTLVIPWFAAAAMCVVGLILTLAIRPDPRTIAFELERAGPRARRCRTTAEPQRRFGQILRRPGVPAAAVAAVASLAVMAGVMNLSGYIVVGHDHQQADVFTVISLHIVGMFGLVLVVGQLVDRVGRHRALVGGLVIMAISTVMLAWVVRIPAISLSLYLLGLGWNVSYVAASAELVTHARPAERQGLVGFTDLVAGLTAAAFALLGGHRLLGIGRCRDGSRCDRRSRSLPRRPLLRAPSRPRRPSRPAEAQTSWTSRVARIRRRRTGVPPSFCDEDVFGQAR